LADGDPVNLRRFFSRLEWQAMVSHRRGLLGGTMRATALTLAILAALAASMMSLPASAGSQKAVVFPFDLDLIQKEEDFFTGPQKPSAEEIARLGVVNDELLKILKSDARFEIIDRAPIAKDIETAAPLHQCNGCEVDLAKKVGGQIAVTGLIDKQSATLLNMTIGFIDVESGKLQRTASVVIQGNTDDTWLRAVRWIMKNRLSAEASAGDKAQ
jgi:hypothetical protein